MKKNRYRGTDEGLFENRIEVVGAILVSLIIVVILAFRFYNTHFDYGTIINGVDCSFLTVKQAGERIEKEFCQDISFTVILPNTNQEEIEYKTYQVLPERLATFEYQFSNVKLLELVMKQQKETRKQEFTLDDLFSINSKAVKEYLQTIPELNGKNIVVPKDAYLKFNEESLSFEIVPEIYGNQPEFEGEEMWYWVVDLLLQGKTKINFSDITKIKPEITQDTAFLKEQQETLNSILSLQFNIKLIDGNIVTLDARIMKDWIEQSENGYSINITDNLPSFIDYLAEKVEKSNCEFIFQATGIGEIILPIPPKVKAQLDKEKQQERLENLLSLSKDLKLQEDEWLEKRDGKVIIWLTPEYKVKPITQRLDSYVELDITRQILWLYINGQCILITPVVTGNVKKGYDTPTGIYFLYNKARGVTLTDHKTYWSWVDYWMCFIPERGIGFHDANWRDLVEFIATTYIEEGSHGCVNMPEKDENDIEVTKILYENLTRDMPIIIYKS